jgi:hypothetical protein
MKAIEQALLTFRNVFEGKTLKWFTDNQIVIMIYINSVSPTGDITGI